MAAFVTANADLANAHDEDAQPTHHHATEELQLATCPSRRLAEVVLVRAALLPARRSDGSVLSSGLGSNALQRPPQRPSPNLRWRSGRARLTSCPRVTIAHFPQGSRLGAAGPASQIAALVLGAGPGAGRA